jgi:hypothetical protein
VDWLEWGSCVVVTIVGGGPRGGPAGGWLLEVGLSKVAVHQCRMCCMMLVAGGNFVSALGCGAVGWRLVGSLMVGARLGLCPVGVGDVCWEWGCVGGLGLAGRRRFAVA